MASFKKHVDASEEFQRKIADSGLEALKKLGESLQVVGKRVATGQAEESPSHVLADAVLGIAEAHAAFRDGALEAATKALKTLRAK
jgi:hypothetical protein